MHKVLIVDDDVELTAMLSRYIRREGFDTHGVHRGEIGVAEALTGQYSIVVMDIMMPNLSGTEALRRIRASSNIPVLMLTARGDNVDRIVGLDMGADDYVPKPCTPGELVARIRAILRRVDSRDVPSGPAPKLLQAGELRLWTGTRRASWQGQELELTGTEFSLLEVLARHSGSLVSKQEISQQAFGKPLEPYDRRIDVHISSIRQKLGLRADGQSWIHSVRGRGYQLLED
ncbi:DNA-binding response regulator [Rubrivivax gelatinosus]|uniref:DNA-binding response regulator n=1 Tax=Rubrivivax gelatinosus TaxID=28068 RepID=A0ABS1DYG3_RUBGE|nr:response regulator transcription factor [Rubrivivax gelatinosus]MBK1614494.1 DNA-binding response regulator [Rubrivivax gelatinosus]MBK1714866.1 DNA-binding response regulator [Rubrivivax gelatinosus]MBZ8143154.1 DNA-binding response regulator [Rubrivivax gelatinosus]